ncbi:hypothetical protein B0J14DRAFT_232334 [Halenospora varia]|nr:hypothetical protein B0J14DRAFT_232334 [Halenospora varia]
MSEPLAHNGSSSTHDKKFDAEQIESREVGAAPLGKRQKTARHCKRFWWVHLIIFCISFLIIALCLVYVAMPKIAQKGVDDSSLEVTEFKFLDPSSSSITLYQSNILHSPSMYTPTLDPFVAGSYLVTNGTFGPEPIIFINMPSIHALHPSSVQTVEQKVAINSLEQLTEYATQVIAKEYVSTALTGSTILHEGKLPSTRIKYNTTSTYKALNGLKGFNVTNVRINVTNTDGSPNMKGYAYIPNPSIMTIEMGNVTLTLSTDKAGIIGTSTIPNMTLKPGNNTLPMTGTLNQTLVLGSTDTTTGIMVMKITGRDCIYNGEHLTYYEKALSQNVLSLSMNVQQIIKDSLTGA